MKLVVKYLLIRKRSDSETEHNRFEAFFDVSAKQSCLFQLLHDPADHCSYRSPQKGTATLANRRQLDTRPATHTRFIQLPNQKTVRKPHFCHHK